MGLQITDRDTAIIKEICKHRFLLARQIRILGKFNGQRACDRRVRKLIDAGYIERKFYITGIARLYTVTRKAVEVFGLDYYTPKIRLDQIFHDIAVVDTVVYLTHNHGIDPASIITERDRKHIAGFSNPIHFADFSYTTQDGKTVCVEVELSAKKQDTLFRNIQKNYKEYDAQIWVIPSDKPKIVESVKRAAQKYGNIEILPLERVIDYVRNS
jgi:hypothetical protein